MPGLIGFTDTHHKYNSGMLLNMRNILKFDRPNLNIETPVALGLQRSTRLSGRIGASGTIRLFNKTHISKLYVHGKHRSKMKSRSSD